MKYVTITERVEELRAKHGSYRAAAEATGIHYAYLFRLAKCIKTEPSGPMLQKLGLTLVRKYTNLTVTK